MPYSSNDDLPEAAKKLSAHAQDAFRQAFNAALKQYDGDEQKAFAVAWSAAKKADGGDDDDASQSREATAAKAPPTSCPRCGAADYERAGLAHTCYAADAWPQERPVRESTVQPQSVRAGIVREGRGYRIKDCQIM